MVAIKRTEVEEAYQVFLPWQCRQSTDAGGSQGARESRHMRPHPPPSTLHQVMGMKWRCRSA